MRTRWDGLNYDDDEDGVGYAEKIFTVSFHLTTIKKNTSVVVMARYCIS